MRFEKLFTLVCLIVVTITSCKTNTGRNINQGEILYHIEYTGIPGQIPVYLKPQNLIVSFKEDKILFDIAAPIGDASITNLSNPKINAYDIYLTLFGQKFIYSCKEDEIPPGFGGMEGMEIKKTSKTTVICGFECMNAEVTFASDRGTVYNIWYTDEIDIDNPNQVTPFRDIDGVLMSFFYFMGDTKMNFKAENVFIKEIPDNLFERKEKFKPVSREKMNNLILQMISF